MDLNEREKQVIFLMAECSLNATEVARRIGRQRTAAVWCCDRIQNKTGHDPRNFYDLVQLIEMLKGEEENA